MKDGATDCAAACARLCNALCHFLPEPGDYATGINGLTLYWRVAKSAPQGDGCAVPHATVVFQGAERVLIGGREFVCGPCECRVNREDAYGTGHISEASEGQPFLAASLRLDRRLLRKLFENAPWCAGTQPREQGAVTVTTADPKVLDAFFRLVLLCRTPLHIPILAPQIVYEIHYLLVGGAPNQNTS